MKRAVAACLAALALAGCTNAQPGKTATNWEVIEFVNNNRVVACIITDGVYSGGVHCDW